MSIESRIIHIFARDKVENLKKKKKKKNRRSLGLADNFSKLFPLKKVKCVINVNTEVDTFSDFNNNYSGILNKKIVNHYLYIYL